MAGMRNVTVCWAPECSVGIAQGRGRPKRYHTPACKMKALRRNGGEAPTQPYPPLEPLPESAPAPTVRPEPVTTRQVRRRKPPAAPAGPPETAGTVPSHPDAGEAQPPVDGAAAGGGSNLEPEPPPASVTQLHLAITENATVPVEIRVHPMVAQYRADLERIGQAATRQGLQVLELAERLVSSATSPAAAANLSKELQRLMDALEAGTQDAAVSLDPSLVIRDRTLAKLRAVQTAKAAAS